MGIVRIAKNTDKKLFLYNNLKNVISNIDKYRYNGKYNNL